MVDRIIRIRVDGSAATRGINQIDGQMQRLGGTTDRVQFQLSRLAGAIAAAFSVRQITAYADAYTNIQNRLRVVTNGTEELARVTSQLLSVANDTRSEYQSTAILFSTLARSTEELGVSQERLLAITTTINQSFAIAGATAQEAANAIRQLSQGLASGALRGDEFNSVAEQAPGLLRAVAAETGKSIGELREFAAQGGITSELLIRSIENYADTVNNEFAQTNRTFSQSLTVTNNNLTEFVGRSQAVQGSLKAIGDALVSVSSNLDEIDRFGTALAAGFTKLFITNEGQIRIFGESIKLALTLPFFEARNAAADFITFLIDLGEPVREALGFGGIFDNLKTNLADYQTDAIAEYKATTDGIKAETQEALLQADRIYGELFNNIGAQASTAADSVGQVNQQVKEVAVTFEQLKKVSQGIDALFSGSLNLFGDDKSGQSDEAAARINQRIEGIKLETQTISSELAFQQAVRRGELSAEIADLELQTQLKIQKAITERDLLLAEKNITDEQKIAAEQAFQDNVTAIEAKAADDRIDVARRERESKLALQTSLATAALDIVSVFGRKSNDAQKKIAVANAVVSGYESAVLAWEAGMSTGGPYAPVVAAAYTAASLAKTGGLIRAINTGGSGGGGGGAAGAATVSLPTQPTAAASVQTLEIVGLREEIERLEAADGFVSTQFVAKVLDKIDSANRLRGEG